MSALSDADLDHLEKDRIERLERLFNFTPPLEPLDIPEEEPAADGPIRRRRPTNELGEWPYEHVPGEREPLPESVRENLEDSP